MKMLYYMGIDVGTTGCKTVIFDQDGSEYGEAYREYPVICTMPHQAEQDAEQVFAMLIQTMSEAVSKAGVRSVEALSISVQGDAVMPVDSDYQLLHPVILGMDYRPNEQCMEYRKEQDEWKLYEITGQPLHPINMMAKIMWFYKKCPEIAEKAYKFITYGEFILKRLGGEAVIDDTMASRSMGYDILERCWSEQILKTMCIPKEQLSDVCRSGAAAGKMNRALAEQIGLKNCPILIAGGHDQPMGAVGAGVIREGMAVDSTGTAEVLSTAYQEIKINRNMHDCFYSCYFHAVPNLYFSFAHMQTGGILQRWYRDTFGYKEAVEAEKLGRNFYEYAQAKCKNEPSSVLVLPHFNGSGTPLCDMDSKGAIAGLTLSSTRHDVLKGILDSLCYELRTNLEAMQRSGIVINELRAAGGGARSSMWLQTKANILGTVIKTMESKEAGCLGAAVLAAAGTGFYRSVEEACKKMVRTAERYEPEPDMQKRYHEKYEVYLELYGSLKAINRRLG